MAEEYEGNEEDFDIDWEGSRKTWGKLLDEWELKFYYPVMAKRGIPKGIGLMLWFLNTSKNLLSDIEDGIGRLNGR